MGEEWQEIHPLVARRGLDFLLYLCKTSFKVTYDMLTVGPAGGDDDLARGGVLEGAWGAGLGAGAGGAKGSSGKGKGKGRKGSSGKAKGKMVEAMDVAGG